MGIVLAAGKYLSWGVISISLTNLFIIVLMVVVFVLALVLPFPHAAAEPPGPVTADEHPENGLQP
jgi:hypothetical protein